MPKPLQPQLAGTLARIACELDLVAAELEANPPDVADELRYAAPWHHALVAVEAISEALACTQVAA